ncbi:MAG: MerR family transcriptional regulator [Caulobacter sp.]|nr:MerR family transcriptional regulator [Caulobacter sp.]
MAKGPNAFRTISEAADELGVPQHVLRFWETKFSFIRPMKRAGGRRFYRPQDIAVLRGVRALLHDEGLTIKGVQKLHKEQGVRRLIAVGAGETVPVATAPGGPAQAGEPARLDAAARDRLGFALEDLTNIKARLDALLEGG